MCGCSTHETAETQFDDSNLWDTNQLGAKGALEDERIRREECAGGRYGQLEIEIADAMLTVGGRMGIYICSTNKLDAGKPVLPVDL